MVAPRSNIRRKSGASHPPLKSSQITSVAAAASALSSQLEAIQLRDEVLHLRKEMNSLKKEKDIAKVQQVFQVWGWCILAWPACVNAKCTTCEGLLSTTLFKNACPRRSDI